MPNQGGRPVKDINSYKDRITTWFLEDRRTVFEIQQDLLNIYNCDVSERLVKRRLKIWGVRQNKRTDDSELLRSRIKLLFFHVSSSEDEMLDVLRAEGHSIERRTLASIRKNMGLTRRTRVPEQREEARHVIRQLVAEELEKGVIQGYGKGKLYNHFRKKGLVITRDLLFREYRDLVPELVAERLYDFNRERGEFITPGPNFLWSVDGHDKLKAFGIEIYGAIDAYSRYVAWIYVGISARTAVSVLSQYLTAVEVLESQPCFIRSDRGGETVLMADAHWQLRSTVEENIPFAQCYFYGTSTANQRIESWWGQLTKSYINRMLTYFRNLQKTGLFSADMLADRIALYAIYLPLLRDQILEFVEVWNVHRIRKQRNRPNVVQGKPFHNFFYPKVPVRDYRVDCSEEKRADLQLDVQEYDPDEYLPPATLAWCTEQLRSLNFDVERPPPIPKEEEKTPHIRVYRALREAVYNHSQSESEPQLGLLATPTGARNWQPMIDSQEIRELDIAGEGSQDGYDAAADYF